MTSEEASRERMRLWNELRPLLVRGLGYEGAAEWLLFASAQMRTAAKRAETPAERTP